MKFKPLQITAFLANGIAVYDDWSPAIEGLLIHQLLYNLDMASPNPTPDQVEKAQSVIDKYLPLGRHPELDLWQCSAPVYQYQCEETTKYRKRWEPNGQVNWGKRKAKYSTSEGPEKSYDLPLFLRLTTRIDWFVMGMPVEINALLNPIAGIGKKRGHGYGQVHQWKVTEIDEDWSLFRDGQLMKPIPVETFKSLGLPMPHNDIIQWGYKPPSWLPDNRALCLMPRVVMQDG
jgi:hypothetical protein